MCTHRNYVPDDHPVEPLRPSDAIRFRIIELIGGVCGALIVIALSIVF